MKMIEDIHELQQKISSESLLAVYFMNDVCAPCQAIRPKITALFSESFPSFNLYFVDSMKYPEIPLSFDIYSNPVLLVFFEGREYIRKSKYISISELEEDLNKYYKHFLSD